jgi:predicted TIM-barrel fold metal-dependent hydrolase
VLNKVDSNIYQNELHDFLPEKIFDCHAHIWLDRHRGNDEFPMRSAQWVSDLTIEYPYEQLKKDMEELLPGKKVEGLFFGYVDPDIDVFSNNRYVGEMAAKHGFHALAVSRPDWTKEETKIIVKRNHFLGLKPYINFVSPKIKTEDIKIFDMVSPDQFEAANEGRYIIVMHLPRPGRIADKENLNQLMTIEKEFPNVKLIVAHIGRAFTVENLGSALDVLQNTNNMLFDFSGNTSAEVISRAINTFGSERILYGSDLPLTRMRMKRIFENGKYINLVEKDLYPAIKNDKSTREVSREEAKGFTLYLYESLLAFKNAAGLMKLTRGQIENIMYRTGRSLVDAAGR